MNKPTKPEALIIKEVRELLTNEVSQVLQETGISFLALEPIMKDLYNDVLQGAVKEMANAEAQYQEELKAFEKAQIPTKPATKATDN